MDQDEDQGMSTDTEAAQTVNHLCMGDLVALTSLQVAICESLALATNPCPEGQEYFYDSNNLVVDFDTEFPDISEQVVEWRVARWAVALLPLWCPRNFGRVECACYEKEPDLREVLT